jgi:hypothetical protein
MTQQIWTEKHLRYCISQRFTPTAIKLYQWLLTEMAEGYTEIIDLRDFQKLVVKERGKPHDFRIIRDSVRRLAEAGVLKTCKRYTNFLWKWTLKPINRLLYPLVPKPNFSEKRSQIPNLQPSNPTNSFGVEITTTTKSLIKRLTEQEKSELEESVELCKQAGFRLEPDAAILMLKGLDKEYVSDAIAYTKAHAQSNPEGYLRRCLEQGWHEKRTATVSLVEVFDLIGRVARGHHG